MDVRRQAASDRMDATPPRDSVPTTARVAADSLAGGVVFMLVLNVVQRAIGFGRNLLFCGLLKDAELGRWSLAFSFLALAAPLAVLGLPGSFGRYVEHYRQRGQLPVFLRRATVVAGVGCAVFCTVMWLAAPAFAWLIFHDPSAANMVRLLAASLVIVVSWNFVAELFVALRQIRLVNILHVISSLVFAGLGVALLLLSWGEWGVLIAFAAGTAVPLLLAVPLLRKTEACRPSTGIPPTHGEMWSRVLPFAGWLWLMNLTCNLFEAVDRFMIVHFARVGRTLADSLVGQYHASRVLPVLLVAVAGALAAMLLPYLSHDWERGERERVTRRLNLALKVVAVAFTFAGVALMLASPVVFGVVMRGKYDVGLGVLPWTIAYCIWFSMLLIVYSYLECAERTRYGVAAVAVGLVANILLNATLLPFFGLAGAVWATTAGNAIALVLMLAAASRHGLAVDRQVWLAALLPILLGLGLWPATIGFAAVLLLEWWRPTLLTVADRASLEDALQHYIPSWMPMPGRQPTM